MLQTFHKNQLSAPCISITSTTIELLEWIKTRINTGTITGKNNYNKEKHKDCYTLTIRYDSAINLLEEITPYLVINTKIKRANLILEKYKSVTSRNGRYSNEMLELKNQFYEEFINIK